MKKILTHLIGIVAVITILVAGACLNSCKQKAIPAEKEADSSSLENDSTITDEELTNLLSAPTTVSIYLKDTLIGCKKHLEMFDEKHPNERSKKVIDSLITDVNPGDVVIWMKAAKTKLKIHHVRLVDSLPWNIDTCMVGTGLSHGNHFILLIPPNADPGTVKYEIIFEDEDKQYWCIDPHLKIPR